MAKMFYSLEEAAAKLGKSEDAVRQMASNGEITEFRDGDRLIFKVDQIDLLAGGDDEHDQSEMSSMIPLADTSAGDLSAMAIDLTDSGFGSGLGAGASGSAAAMDAGGSGAGSVLDLDTDLGSSINLTDSSAGEDPNEKTGISVFDAGEVDEADPMAGTLMSSDVGGSGLDALSLDTGGSGSGLMDLTRESDDTSLGAEGLLDDIFSGDDTGAGMASGETISAEDTGLFEGAGDAEETLGDEAGAAAAAPGAGGAAAAVLVAGEAYDPKGSGLAFGALLVACLAMAGALAMMIMSHMGAPLNVQVLNDNLLYITGGAAGAAVLLGIVFWALAKKK